MGEHDSIGPQRVQHLNLTARQTHQHLVFDIGNIAHPLAQIFVLDIAEGFFDLRQRLRISPFGRIIFPAHQRLCLLLDARIVEHRQLGVEYLRQLLPMLTGDQTADPPNLVPGLVQRIEEALDLAADLVIGEPATGDNGRALAIYECPADTDTGCDAKTAEDPLRTGRRQDCSSKLLCSNTNNASTAASASSPSALTVICAPCSAASIITPIMLLPLTCSTSSLEK